MIRAWLATLLSLVWPEWTWGTLVLVGEDPQRTLFGRWRGVGRRFEVEELQEDGTTLRSSWLADAVEAAEQDSEGERGVRESAVISWARRPALLHGPCDKFKASAVFPERCCTCGAKTGAHARRRQQPPKAIDANGTEARCACGVRLWALTEGGQVTALGCASCGRIRGNNLAHLPAGMKICPRVTFEERADAWRESQGKAASDADERLPAAGAPS